MNITVNNIEISPLYMSYDMRHQKCYCKINDDWGFIEDTTFPNMFDFVGEIKVRYTVWRGDTELTHIQGNIISDPYTGELSYIEFNDIETAFKFCLQVMNKLQ